MKTEGQGMDITRFINENGLEEQISVPFWVILQCVLQFLPCTCEIKCKFV